MFRYVPATAANFQFLRDRKPFQRVLIAANAIDLEMGKRTPNPEKDRVETSHLRNDFSTDVLQPAALFENGHTRERAVEKRQFQGQRPSARNRDAVQSSRSQSLSLPGLSGENLNQAPVLRSVRPRRYKRRHSSPVVPTRNRYPHSSRKSGVGILWDRARKHAQFLHPQ